MIFLRKTLERDIEDIYANLHLDYVKKYCKDEESKQWENHKTWYKFLINSTSYLLYTLLDEKNKFLGYIQFELDGEFAIINIYFIKEIRGKGLSLDILKISLDELSFTNSETSIVFAYILEENIPSIKTFKKLGFVYDGLDEYKGMEHMLFIKPYRLMEE